MHSFTPLLLGSLTGRSHNTPAKDEADSNTQLHPSALSSSTAQSHSAATEDWVLRQPKATALQLKTGQFLQHSSTPLPSVLPGATALQQRPGQFETHSSITLPHESIHSLGMELLPPEQRLRDVVRH
eukprot:gene15362-21448_t